MAPGILTVAAKGEYAFAQPPENVHTSLARRGLADWIASTDNPLTARVMVNRIWQHHFGEGTVRTPSNFGKTGEPRRIRAARLARTEFVSKGGASK